MIAGGPGAPGEETDDGPADVLVSLEAPFVDGRGTIQPLVDRKMSSALLIRSNPGTVRANHYHRTDWHYCYVLEGAIEYFHRPHGSAAPPQRVVVPKGGMVFTPPMVEHAMRFAEETLFLTLGRNPRDHESYEADVVRVEVIES